MLLVLRPMIALVALLVLSVATAFAQDGPVATGKDDVIVGKVPAVIGQSTKKASAAVRAAGLVSKFHLGRTAASMADSLKVYAVEPQPGTQLAPGAEVHCVVFLWPFRGVSLAGERWSESNGGTDVSQR